MPHPSDARTTLAVITPRGRRAATDATQDLNATVYERIGLPEQKRSQLIELLAELRASGNEFDVEHSNEVIEEVGFRQARQRGGNGRKGGLGAAENPDGRIVPTNVGI